MKCIVVLLAVVALAAGETYSTENDNLDIESVVSNQESLQAFLDCFLDKKPCDDVQAGFKKDLADAVEKACSKCTNDQKHLLRRFLEEVEKKIPKGYTEFKNKYDSEGKYFSSLQSAISTA